MDRYALAIMWTGLVARPLGIRPKETTVYHVTGHAPLASSANDEADTLAKVQWLEMVMAGQSERDIAQWLHCHLSHAGQNTMWFTLKSCGVPVTLAELQEFCETCVVCSEEQPQRPVGTNGQVVQGWVPLTQWQIDVIEPLPSLEGYKYAITCVDMATGLLTAYPAWHLDQKAVIAVLDYLCTAYG